MRLPKFKQKRVRLIVFGPKIHLIPRFKKVHHHLPIYSVRIDLDWRAVGTLREDTVVWFWIGPHSEYEKLLGHCVQLPSYRTIYCSIEAFHNW